MTTESNAPNTGLIRLFGGWRNIWQSGEPGEATPRPSGVSPLVGAIVLGLALYSWPSWTYLHPVAFYVGGVVIWLLGVAAAMAVGVLAAESAMATGLRDAEHRIGLVRCEWIGLLASVVLCVGTFAAPIVAPLALACLLGFSRLLLIQVGPRRNRRFGRVRIDPLPDQDDGADVTDPEVFDQREFRWRLIAGGRNDANSMTVPIRLTTLAKLRARQPKVRWDGDEPRMDLWVSGGITAEVHRAALTLEAMAEEHKYSTFTEISNVLAFVQSVEYVSDLESTGMEDYWKYPTETMHDENGDCDDTTILGAAVLHRMGYTVGTIYLPSHAALAVEVPPGTPGTFVEVNGHRMYYCETTATGWKIGEVPPDMKDTKMMVTMVNR